ncbi:MAG: hypothetical protein PHE49_10050 [bacterium]|nr:hypothetical protein [bacterium]
MGTYSECPFGTIKGSVGPLTFACIKGHKIVYMKTDKSKLAHFTGKVVNINTINLFISSLHHQLFKKFLLKYWDIKKLSQSGHNLFAVLLKENFALLYDTLPDKNIQIGAKNWVNMEALRLTYKHTLIEPIHITGITYSNGELHVKWDTSCFIGGKPDDTANIVVIHSQPKSSSDIHKRFSLKVYYKTALRKDAGAIIETDASLEPDYFTAFLFFSNGNTYSHSVGLNYAHTMPHAL